MKKRAEIWTIGGIILIGLLSFFTFSENFFPLLNSDMAVNILMTPSFSLPHDVYFWGQDRSGNIIPLLAHWCYVLTGWQPVVIVSLVHYLILAGGFWALCRFLKTPYTRLAAALVWFIPPWHFREFLLILYGVQTSCVLLALNFLDRSFGTRSQWKCLAWLSASSMMFIIAVWVSDMALISILALMVTGFAYVLFTRKDPIKLIAPGGLLIPASCLAIWTLAGFLLLHYAKQISVPVKAYNQGFMADPASMLHGLRIVMDSVFRVFVFSSESSIESVFAWGLLISIVYLFLSGKKNMKAMPVFSSNPWFYFFLFEAALTMAAVISSSWVAENGTARRYFTTFFVSAFISFLLWLGNHPETRRKKYLKIAFALVILSGSLSGISRFYIPEIKPSRIRVLSALKSMGDIGIIAEYWNSYMSASPDPVHIRATPHDKDYVRNPDLAAEVLQQKKIYLIKDGWLESFPDTIVQFGHTLKKKGTEFHIADAWMNRYEVVRR